ncbi:MAG: hypothetical protein A3F83_12485 [Candidatus Glassbacteria bacterium RIFCSPLOWO2_12_FULL_58_11]|uniref:DUF4832 domain-containing protein n=1 Tax=Candidatus Glassbacteria bacterium RIFCSPLOWO2_12_FULL_58_11 TaxID=1817867 RepID=A0A1F5Z2I0_9BACT|nr:MAG: hypothetical protein A3F83_12485 [Candidatus Glassbacteria bacterium RIFCSPLOWO2_12_FULL_58_11]
MRILSQAGLAILIFCNTALLAQDTVIVRPQESDEVLVNPGIGFNTFQRFNGDTLNPGDGWTEGFPIDYQPFRGSLENPDYPASSTAYFRIYWKFVEPEMGKYNWDMFDRALKTAAERGQTLLLRIAPYGSGPERDVPAWYRERVGPEKKGQDERWRVDPEDPRYDQYFGGLIRALGARYDGHPDLESVDISIVGYWGEGSGSHLLSEKTRKALLRSYLDSFKKTDLIFQPLNGDAPDPGVLVEGLPIATSFADGRADYSGPDIRYLGWRADCLGDIGFFRSRHRNWTHMADAYPEDIIKSGMRDAWKKAPVTLEICGTMLRWQADKFDIDYIIDQSLKWHISSFNAKSSPVPKEWWPQVNRWLKHMGYRLVLRKFTYPSIVRPHGKLAFTSWWENKGVAPCYKKFPFALRLKNPSRTEVLLTDADIRGWLPGDAVYDDAVFLPLDLPEGEYDLAAALLDPRTRQPKVKLAVTGVGSDGWYSLGKITVKETLGE